MPPLETREGREIARKCNGLVFTGLIGQGCVMDGRCCRRCRLRRRGRRFSAGGASALNKLFRMFFE